LIILRRISRIEYFSLFDSLGSADEPHANAFPLYTSRL